MSKLITIVLLTTALGWWLETVADPWLWEKWLAYRARREMHEREALRKILQRAWRP